MQFTTDSAKYTSTLPRVRCSDELREKLMEVTQRSVSNDMADHIRFAVEQYVNRELAKDAPAKRQRRAA